MSIKVRGLNPDETFCCSKKDFLKVFGSVDEAFTVYFGGLGIYSRDEVKNGDKRPCVRKGYNDPSHYILMGMTLEREADQWGDIGFAWFTILKKEYYSEEKRQRFVKEMLPKIYELYKKYRGNKILEETEYGRYRMSVAMVGDKFVIEESIT